MARTSRKTLETLLGQLAAATGTALELSIWNPDGRTRYQLFTSLESGGVSERPYGGRVYSASEMEIALRMALNGAEAMNPELFQDRLNAYWENREN